MNNISLDSINKTIIHVLKRYHVIMYVLFVIGGLGIGILSLNHTINLSSESNGYVSNANSIKFDQATIDRVDKLKTVDQNNNTIDFNNGRTDPFVEK